MSEQSRFNSVILGLAFIIGLFVLGYMGGSAVKTFKEFERTVTVKGLSEREYPADIVIWPIQFTEAGNNLSRLYTSIEESNQKIRTFLGNRGIEASEITASPPAITDKSARNWGNNATPEFRYSAEQTVTVYSKNIDTVRAAMANLSELGKADIAFTGGDYASQTQYLFTRLNEIKPEMVEEATKNAREVAVKFAQDSQSKLGKIKRASQGLFSIQSRDSSTPYIKKVRVVTTVEYYLSD